jgi:hypothetical protein
VTLRRGHVSFFSERKVASAEICLSFDEVFPVHNFSYPTVRDRSPWTSFSREKCILNLR